MNDEHPTDNLDGSTDPWESEMSREFDKRVRDLHEAPLTFENVKGKAMTIRRNRRIAVAGGVLAAAAVVVPVAVLADNGLGDSNDKPDFASNSPSSTQATDPNDPTPTEARPPSVAVSYLAGSTWHRADGSSVELDETYFSGVELGDQLFATRNDDDTGGLTTDVINADGEVEEGYSTLSYPVANDDHTTIAYIDTKGGLMTRWADGKVSMGAGYVDGDSVAAITGGPNCYEAVDGCRAFINHGDGSPAESADSHGIVDTLPGGAMKVRDVSSDGLIAAQTESTDSGSCSTVYDEQAGAEVFKTCKASLFAFSPDGSHITGSAAYLDGLGPGYVTILDATTGAELARFTAKQGFVRESLWEDPDHLLVNAYEKGAWQVYRLGVDGSTEPVLSSSTGDDMTPAFSLLGGS